MRVAVERPPECIDELISDERGLLRVTKQILPADDSRLLLVIDQFEELFSAVGAEETRRLFLDSLVTIATDERSRMRVVLTMRADFFDRPLEYPEFGDLMSAGLVTVSPPTEEGLAQAIAAPARAVGVDLEPGLVGEIIRDVADQPGALPLLQYALTELFNRRQGNVLTLDAYRSTGGVAGALGRRAEELYEGLSRRGSRSPARSSSGWWPSTSYPVTPVAGCVRPSSRAWRSIRRRSTPCSASLGPFVCSPTTGTPSPGVRPSRWHTRRCSGNGIVSPVGSTPSGRTSSSSGA